MSGTSTYVYDYDDNLTTYTDANSATTTATYDAIDRILTASSVRSGYPTDNVAWTYDNTSAAFGQGRLTSVTDPSGSNSFTYDRRGLVKSENPIIASNSYSLSYAYDLNGNRITLTYPSGTSVTYGYDFADRPNSASWGSTQLVSSAAYEPFGPIASILFGNSTTQAISYNQRYQPTENKLSSGSTIADYLYSEDGVGNITAITDNVNSGYDRTFGPYDDLNRLTTANSGSSLWGTATGNGYTYDKMGNILTLTLGTAHTATFAYSGTLPKLTSVTDNTQNSGAPQSISYDSAGNETAIGSSGYTYSPRNLLASGDGLTYTYDSRGVRVETSGSPGTRYSIYNSDLSLLSESALTSNSTIYNYVWFAGRPIAQVNTSGGTNVFYNFTDHLGTPEIQTNSSGAVNWQAEYEPYGRVFALRAGDVHQPLRLPGQVAEQFDMGANGATAKAYNVNRWYYAVFGRYSQGDPLGLPAGVNMYAYSYDDPEEFIDPMGLWAITGALYAGVGGEITIGCSNQTLFATLKAGVGLGTGYSFDPFAGLPAQNIPSGSKPVLSFGLYANEALTLGPFEAKVFNLEGDVEALNGGQLNPDFPLSTRSVSEGPGFDSEVGLNPGDWSELLHDIGATRLAAILKGLKAQAAAGGDATMFFPLSRPRCWCP